MLVWGHHAQNRIFQLQKKAIRIVYKTTYYAHTDPLFKKNNVLKFFDLHKLACIKFYQKYKNDKLPYYFTRLFESNIVQHRYDTRFHDVRPQVANKVFTSKCIRYIIPDLVRKLPNNITEKFNTHSLHGLSNYVKKFYINKYFDRCTKDNCYVCNS